MRNRPVVYAQHQYASTSEPIYVVSIEFSPASFEYFSSHAGIPDIPAGVIESVLEDFSSVSQSFDPETGASRIGSLSIMLDDRAELVTDVLQSRLAAGTGPRNKQLRLYKGFAGMSFDDFERKWTQVIHELKEDHARYTISCSDQQRSMRTEIFQLKTTVLDATLDAAETGSMTVTDTSEFQMVEHGTSYAHGPSQTWGYVKIDDEVIGYQGMTAGTFTGLDRGMFNTLQVEHVVDPADEPERRPEVEEYVYLQMPVPKLIKALMTGVLHGQTGTLPAGWHEGIDISLIDDSQFTGIGPDLWDPANDAVGLPALFNDVGSINGKRFIESELFLLAQIFSPVLSDGRLGLKRFTPALARAAHLVTLNEQNVVKHSALKHSMREVFNRVVLNWSWIAGEFRRQTIKLDTDSIAKHGQAPIKVYNFRALHSSIATKTVLDARFDAIRDRFSAPPLGMSTVVSKSLDRMELGDVVLVQLPNVRDSSAETVNPIDRAFEIRQIRENRKQLQFVLSGSAAEAVPEPPTAIALPDAYYDQAGTELSTVVTIVGGVTQAGTFTLSGDASLGAAGAIFYYIGNLTISANTILNLDDNVQLRVRGFITWNGDADGIGRGLSGVADSGAFDTGPSGLAGFFGATVGGDGATHDEENDAYKTTPSRGFVAGASAAPFLNLQVSGNSLLGLPDSLLGCSGGPGGKLVNDVDVQVSAGGTGGDGGAGLLIVSRGISFGAGASIDLSGGDGAAGLEATLGSRQFFPGGGGGGAPGAMYILIDGNQLVPDVPTVFSALGGNTPITGIPIPYPYTKGWQLSVTDHTGYRDNTRRISDANWTDGAFRVQYVPVLETPVEDLPDVDLSIYYILATAGNAIHNGVGNLTVEAHRVTAGTDELLSTGTTKLFDPGNNEVTAANGYVAGSDGYTGILDSGDITGDIIITLKDGPTGPPLDTITLVDIADGSPGGSGSDGADAVYGFIEPENGLSWSRATNAGAWTPAQLTTDLDCTFVQAGVEVARITRRLTLNSADGTILSSTVVHKGGDLNTSRVNVTLVGNGTTAVTVQFAYSFGGEDASVAETATSSQGGDDGSAGSDGSDGATGQRARTVSIFRKNSNSINSSSGSFADPIAGNTSWSYSVPALTIDGDIVYSATRTFTDDALAPQDANWSTPTIYSQRADGSDGSDGADGSDGGDAVTGFIEPENGLAWTRAVNAGAWSPSQATTDLDATFTLGGVVVARIARRITLNTTDGTLTAAATTHKGGDLNTGRVTVTVSGSASTAITVQFDYSFGGDTGSTAATVETVQGGSDADPVVTLSNRNVTNVGLGGSPRNAGLRFNVDGTKDQKKSTYTQVDSSTDYVRPNEWAPGLYEIRATKTGGSVLGSALSTWLDMSAGPHEWYVQSTGVDETATVTISMRRNGGATLDSSVNVFEAEVVGA